MGFAAAVASGFSNYFNFSGRASRSEYWWFHLFYVLCIIVAFIPAGFSPEPGLVISLVLVFVILVYLGLVIPSLSVGVRRLHDLDMTGLWYLLIFVPFGSFALLILFLIEGNESKNRFGKDPLSVGLSAGQRDGPNKDTYRYSRSDIPKVPRN